MDAGGIEASRTAEGRWRGRAEGQALAIAVFAVLAGAGLRTAMARGDLWLDELWSLSLVQRVRSAPEIFYGISHDNNHFLNSLWLYAIGPGRAPWLYRVPAVCLGALSVALAALAEWPRSRAGAAFAALFAATALPLVVFGSEARGYAGLIAATLLAVAAFETLCEGEASGDPGAGAARWSLGVAVGAGTLCHLTMLAVLPVFGFAALLHLRAGRPMARTLDAVVGLFGPSLVLLLPAMLAVAAGIAVRGHFESGGVSPASPESFVAGYGLALQTTLGLPAGLPPWIGMVAAAAVALACLAGLDGLRRAELAAAAVLLPAAMLLARVPNLGMARYYLVPALVLLLSLARALGCLWDAGGWRRAAATLLTALLLAGYGLADRTALRVGRGAYGAALAGMADSNGQVRYATRTPFQVEMVATAAARRRGLTATLVPDGSCAAPPDWLIEVPDDGSPPPDIVTAGPPACRSRFQWQERVETNPLSGLRWDLYLRLG